MEMFSSKGSRKRHVEAKYNWFCGLDTAALKANFKFAQVHFSVVFISLEEPLNPVI